MAACCNTALVVQCIVIAYAKSTFAAVVTRYQASLRSGLITYSLLCMPFLMLVSSFRKFDGLAVDLLPLLRQTGQHAWPCL